MSTLRDRLVERGLPAVQLQSRSVQLHAATKILVLAVSYADDSGLRRDEVFVRGLAETAYRPLVPEQRDLVCTRCPIVTEAPYVFALVEQRTYRPDGATHSFSAGVVRAQLGSGITETWDPNGPPNAGCFLVELCGASADAAVLYAIAGLSNSEPGQPRGHIDYALVSIPWSTKAITRLTGMPDVFF